MNTDIADVVLEVVDNPNNGLMALISDKALSLRTVTFPGYTSLIVCLIQVQTYIC